MRTYYDLGSLLCYRIWSEECPTGIIFKFTSDGEQAKCMGKLCNIKRSKDKIIQ